MGSCVVVWDRDYCLLGAERQLKREWEYLQICLPQWKPNRGFIRM